MPTHSCMSVALSCSCVSVASARSCVSVASARSCVSAALSCSCVSVASAHSCVSAALACSCVSAASAHSCVCVDGVSVGCLSACGAREKKHDIWLHDKASAMPFFLPGTCISAMVKLRLAANRNRHQKRSAICPRLPLPGFYNGFIVTAETDSFTT